MRKIDVQYFEVIILVLLALISDIRTYKIKNIIVFPFMIIGMVTNTLINGFEGFMFSLAGCIIPVILLILLYILRMLGAGDIKLFSAIGAIMGSGFVLYTIAYSFLCGGVMALCLMIIHKHGKQRLYYLYRYLKTCLITLSVHPYTDFEDKTDGAKFHFAYAVACGTLITLILY
ncbi:MAG: A24 family peptidase [Firmicutes bacterium]|nr:A24 family peptidase [Bacillota bacterium]